MIVYYSRSIINRIIIYDDFTKTSVVHSPLLCGNACILHEMFSKADSAYAEKPDIKWNFTKFLIDREGNVVERFEPTATQEVLAPAVEKLL